MRSQRARWLDMAQQNAKLSLDSYLADKQNVLARFVDLQEALELEDLPERLECFDISHSSGEATVASCVVFDSNGPLKSDYRRFNIEGVAAGDDYGAMNQALRRRYERLKSGDGVLPDILVIDGGPGQLNQAREVLCGSAEWKACRFSASRRARRASRVSRRSISATRAKYRFRRTAARCICCSTSATKRIDSRSPDTGSDAARARRQSELDGIAGVGPKRRRELLRHFGSVAALRGASREEIAKVPGVSRKLAEEIYATLHVE